MELEGVEKAFGRLRVLDGVTLHIPPGRSVCLAGANAAGKTTLLSIAAGLQKPDAGAVLPGGRTGFVPQENTLLEELTVRENLQLWYAAYKRKGRVFAPRSIELELGLEPYARKRVRTLSGGIRKRAAIACALAGEPECLLMDEPFTALDMAGRGQAASLIRSLCAQGRSVLFSSHDPEAICAAADSVALLRDGKVGALHPLENGDTRMASIISLLAGLTA